MIQEQLSRLCEFGTIRFPCILETGKIRRYSNDNDVISVVEASFFDRRQEPSPVTSSHRNTFGNHVATSRGMRSKVNGELSPQIQYILIQLISFKSTFRQNVYTPGPNNLLLFWTGKTFTTIRLTLLLLCTLLICLWHERGFIWYCSQRCVDSRSIFRVWSGSASGVSTVRLSWIVARLCWVWV